MHNCIIPAYLLGIGWLADFPRVGLCIRHRGRWRPLASAGPYTPAPNSQSASYLRTSPAHCQIIATPRFLGVRRELELRSVYDGVYVCNFGLLVLFLSRGRESLEFWCSSAVADSSVGFLNPPLEHFLLFILHVSILSCVFAFINNTLTFLSPVVFSASESCSNRA